MHSHVAQIHFPTTALGHSNDLRSARCCLRLQRDRAQDTPAPDHIFEAGPLVPRDATYDVQIMAALSDGTYPIEHGTSSVEAALSHFWCSHGIKVYTPGMTLCRYLNPRAQIHFSLFTMFKPYLILMYQMLQITQLIKATKDVNFEKEVEHYSKAHPAIGLPAAWLSTCTYYSSYSGCMLVTSNK